MMIMNSLRPEPKKSTLGRFRPETQMPGRWIGLSGLVCIVGSFLVHQWVGMIPGFVLAAIAALLGKLGLDSKGRAIAWVSLIGGIVLIGVYLTVLIIGTENIGISPK